MSLRLPLIVMACLSLAVAALSFRFVLLGLEEAFGGLGSFRAGQTVLLAVHVSLGPVALALGAIQFLPKLRASRPTLHRWIGRIYVAAVGMAGVSGLLIAPSVPGGWVSATGFGLLAVLWLISTALAFTHARARRIVDHRQWMIRSFALTFAAVTLRLYLPMFFAGGLDYDAAAPLLAWLCWVPNLIVAELLLRRLAEPGAKANPNAGAA